MEISDQLKAILDKMPKLADGIAIPGQTVYYNRSIGITAILLDFYEVSHTCVHYPDGTKKEFVRAFIPEWKNGKRLSLDECYASRDKLESFNKQNSPE